jgi:hypothetical protein
LALNPGPRLSLGWCIVGCDPKGHVSENRGQISAWCAGDLRFRVAIVMVSVNFVFARKRQRPCLSEQRERRANPERRREHSRGTRRRVDRHRSAAIRVGRPDKTNDGDSGAMGCQGSGAPFSPSDLRSTNKPIAAMIGDGFMKSEGLSKTVWATQVVVREADEFHTPVKIKCSGTPKPTRNSGIVRET